MSGAKRPDDPDHPTRLTGASYFDNLFRAVLGLPTAIYKQGYERGQVSRQNRANQECHENDRREGGRPRAPRRCPHDLNGDDVEGKNNGHAEALWLGSMFDMLDRMDKYGRSVYQEWKGIERKDSERKEGSSMEVGELVEMVERLGFIPRIIELMPDSPQLSDKILKELDRKGVDWRKRMELKALPPAYASDEGGKSIADACPARESWWSGRKGSQEQRETSLSEDMMATFHEFERAGSYQHFCENNAWGYLALSPYSPMHLEEDIELDGISKCMFEDLLRAQSGRKLMNPQELERIRTLGWSEWFQHQWVHFSQQWQAQDQADRTHPRTHHLGLGDSSRQSPLLESVERMMNGHAQAEAQMASELDVYEREEDATSGTTLWRGLPKRDAGTPRSSIAKSVWRSVSSHTEPDGSVTTKTVVKRRFADGTEENSESVETTPKELPQKRIQAKQAGRSDFEVGKMNETGLSASEKRKGWFWSNK